MPSLLAVLLVSSSLLSLLVGDDPSPAPLAATPPAATRAVAPTPAVAPPREAPPAPPARAPTAFEVAAGWTDRSPPAASDGRALLTDFADLPEGRLGVAIQLQQFELRADVLVDGEGSLQLEHGDALVGAALADGLGPCEGPDDLPAVVLTADTWHALAVRADDHELLIRIDGVPVFRGPALARGAPVMLRRLSGAAWLANLALRDLDELPGRPVNLFPQDDLTGWLPLGDAIWIRGPDEVLGEVGGGGQSFLVTARTFGDFVFEVWLRNEDQGNSGIQVRSHLDERQRLSGYQIEIDPSPRAWSGGLYDEARRGWLDDLADDPLARSAFRNGQWNHYRIECIGPSVRAWVNGLATADVLDPLDLSGLIGLQVHSGDNTRVRWREPRLQDLGTRLWSGVLGPDSLSSWTQERTAWRAEEGRLVGEGGGLLIAPELLTDGALRVEFRSAGELALVVRAPDGGDLSSFVVPEGLTREPGLHTLHGGGLVIRPAPVETWATLTVCLAGDRVVAHVDGRLLGEQRGVPSRAGRVALVSSGDGALVRRVERLTEARR